MYALIYDVPEDPLETEIREIESERQDATRRAPRARRLERDVSDWMDEQERELYTDPTEGRWWELTSIVLGQCGYGTYGDVSTADEDYIRSRMKVASEAWSEHSAAPATRQ